MIDSNDALRLIAEEDVKFVDLRLTDPRGKLQHVSLMADQVDEDLFEEGMMFDGSSIAGWKSIEVSDMKMMPDPAVLRGKNRMPALFDR